MVATIISGAGRYDVMFIPACYVRTCTYVYMYVACLGTKNPMTKWMSIYMQLNAATIRREAIYHFSRSAVSEATIRGQLLFGVRLLFK